MAVTQLPALSWAAPLVDLRTGAATPYFQRAWQGVKIAAADGANTTVDVSGKVDKGASTGWSAPTGTYTKTAFATYAAPTISATPTQAEVQAIANHVQVLSEHLAALIEDLLTSSQVLHA